MGDCWNYSNSRYGKNKHTSMDTKRYSNRNQDKYGFSSNNVYGYNNSSKICGIINLGNNCYLNSGLQILASCRELVYELKKINSDRKIIPYIRNAVNALLTQNMYDPSQFMDYFCSMNSDFIRGAQCCSQNFIRTLINNMNKDLLYTNCEIVNGNNQYNPSGNEYTEYIKFISAEKIFPESKIQSIFSGITKSFSKGKCRYCYMPIENYSFNYFIDYNLYLDDCGYRCNFSEVLKSNIGCAADLSMDCPNPNCRRNISIKEVTKFIKLPDILIFTLERYQGETNDVRIKPDAYIYLNEYIDDSLKSQCTKYELFAINIRYGKSANFGHEICQVKRDGIWYEINDREGYRINGPSNEDSSYGLFYRKADNYSKNDYSPIYVDNMNKNTKNFDDYNFGSNEIRTDIKKKDIKDEIKEINDLLSGGKSSTVVKTNNYKNQKFTRIKNYGHKEFNSGFQILYLIEEFKTEIQKFDKKGKFLTNIMKDAFETFKNDKEYDTFQLLSLKSKEKFTESIKTSLGFIINTIFAINDEFKKEQNSFYTTKLKYENVINNKKNELSELKKFMKCFNSESKILSFFSCIIRIYFKGKCPNKSCTNNKIDSYSFEYFINQNIVLNNTNKMINSFSDILDNNNQNSEPSIEKCPKCKRDIKVEITKKIIKLPEILIFSIENKDKTTAIRPDISIDMKKFIEPSLADYNTKYELIAVTSMTKDCYDYKHYCQVKVDGKWYEVYDNNYKEINPPNYNSDVDGLLYRRIKK